jgi:hypothetical protein
MRNVKVLNANDVIQLIKLSLLETKIEILRLRKRINRLEEENRLRSLPFKFKGGKNKTFRNS